MNGLVWATPLIIRTFGSGVLFCIACYYEGESGFAYLIRRTSENTRKTAIWTNVTASAAWAINEVIFGLMAWFNLIALLFLLPVVKKVYDDYMQQRKAGVAEPFFDPQKLGIKNCDVWMDINKKQIEQDKLSK